MSDIFPERNTMEDAPVFMVSIGSRMVNLATRVAPLTPAIDPHEERMGAKSQLAARRR